MFSSTSATSKSRNSHGEQGSDAVANLTYKLTRLKRQIQSERVAIISEKLEKNSKRIQAYVTDLKTLTESRNELTAIKSNDSDNSLSLRMVNPLCKVGGLIQGSVDRDAVNSDRDNVNSQEVAFSATARFPMIEKLLPYTTWIFLDSEEREYSSKISFTFSFFLPKRLAYMIEQMCSSEQDDWRYHF